MRWMKALLGKRQMGKDLDKEIRYHLEQQIRDFIAEGIDPKAARRRAVLSFGGPSQIKEECRDARPLRWMETVMADLRYAFRALRSSPAFTLTAVLSVALGIGANTAIFTLLHAALWKPLPVPAPHELYHLARTSSQAEGEFGYSWVLYQELLAATKSYGELFAVAGTGPQKFSAPNGSDDRIIGGEVTGSYFQALRIKPSAGRLIESTDDSDSGGKAVLVLSHSFWIRRFQGDPSIVGKLVMYSEKPFTVIGVAEPGFSGIDAGVEVDAWVPTAVMAQSMLPSIQNNWLAVLIRLKPGVNPEVAHSAIEARFQRHLSEELLPALNLHYKSMVETQRISLRRAASGRALEGRKYETPLLVLLAIVALVLLISCANLANLILARNLARQREIGVRLALGAGRGRIVSQLLTESLMIAMAGATFGTFLALWGCRFLLHLLPPSQTPLVFDLRPDGAVLGFTAFITIMTAILCGLGPALRACSAGMDRIQMGSDRVTRRSFAGKMLVSGQFALSMILLAGAGLFLTTLHKLASADLGFRPEQTWSVDVSPPRSMPADRKARFTKDVIEHLSLQAIPISASFVFPSVYSRGGWSVGADPDGRKAAPGEDHEVCSFGVGPGFFEILQIALVEAVTWVNAPMPKHRVKR